MVTSCRVLVGCIAGRGEYESGGEEEKALPDAGFGRPSCVPPSLLS